MNTDIIYKFIGEPGSFVVGAPARDIQEWEVVADPEIGKVVEANMQTRGPIYAKVAKPVGKATKVVVEPVVTEEKPSV